jgi:hypothetical protein
MTKGRPWIEYKVGPRFCDTRAESTSHPHTSRESRSNCELLVQIRALIEWIAPKLHCHNGARPAAVPLYTARFERFLLFGLRALPPVTGATTSAAICRELRRCSRVVGRMSLGFKRLPGWRRVPTQVFCYAARALSMRPARSGFEIPLCGIGRHRAVVLAAPSHVDYGRPTTPHNSWHSTDATGAMARGLRPSPLRVGASCT